MGKGKLRAADRISRRDAPSFPQSGNGGEGIPFGGRRGRRRRGEPGIEETVRDHDEGHGRNGNGADKFNGGRGGGDDG